MLSVNSLVLVCHLPTPRDLEIARVLGWYRIPFRSAPKVIAVDYLAFYQPGSFGAHAGQIQFIAQVRGHELTTRAELLRDEPDHPRANEEYFKVQLGALERLSEPIKAEKWRRITFFYTTGEYLLNAKTINELVVNSDERHLLWHSLREREAGKETYKTDQPEKWCRAFPFKRGIFPKQLLIDEKQGQRNEAAISNRVVCEHNWREPKHGGKNYRGKSACENEPLCQTLTAGEEKCFRKRSPCIPDDEVRDEGNRDVIALCKDEGCKGLGVHASDSVTGDGKTGFKHHSE